MFESTVDHPVPILQFPRRRESPTSDIGRALTLSAAVIEITNQLERAWLTYCPEARPTPIMRARFAGLARRAVAFTKPGAGERAEYQGRRALESVLEQAVGDVTRHEDHSSKHLIVAGCEAVAIIANRVGATSVLAAYEGSLEGELR